jgi:hypothetical protein
MGLRAERRTEHSEPRSSERSVSSDVCQRPHTSRTRQVIDLIINVLAIVGEHESRYGSFL